MIFEWDPEKSDSNRQRRGFGFDFAALVFSGRTVDIEDDRFDYGEVRIRAIGSARGTILAVIYTDREDVRRIISARRANRKEQNEWLSSE